MQAMNKHEEMEVACEAVVVAVVVGVIVVEVMLMDWALVSNHCVTM